MTVRKTLLCCLAISVGYTLLFFVLGAFSFNPGVGEGADLDPASLRYRIGNDLDSLMPVLLMPFMPYLSLRDRLGIPATAWDGILMPASLFLLTGGFCLGIRLLCLGNRRLIKAMEEKR
jgi:hypothetical protein